MTRSPCPARAIRLFSFAAAAVAVLTTSSCSSRRQAGRSAGETIVVSAASSLTDVMQSAGVLFEKTVPGISVRFNFGSSGALQRQIENGAPVDVFVSASTMEMETLRGKELVVSSSVQTVARNSLILIARTGSPVKSWSDLTAPGVRKIAISDPNSVPSGRYAQETLEHRRLWNQVRDRLVFGENVRQTLSYVLQGNADAGVVFATDVKTTQAVRTVDHADEAGDHDPILYPAAVVTHSRHQKAAAAFVRFLAGAECRPLFRQLGFLPPRV